MPLFLFYNLILQKNQYMNKCFLSIAFVVMSLYCFSQDTYTISGYVTDKSSGENLIGVSIYTLPGYKGTASNNYGFYTLSIPEGEYEIIYQSIENLHKACPNHTGDWYFTGNYPTPGGNRVVNNAFINFYEGNKKRAY